MRLPGVLCAMPQNNKMFVKLTPAGEAAVWQWAQAVKKDADLLTQSACIAQAHKQLDHVGDYLWSRSKKTAHMGGPFGLPTLYRAAAAGESMQA